MQHSLLGADAPARVVHEQQLEQVAADVVEALDERAVVLVPPYPLGEAGLEVGEAGDAGPVGLGGRAEDAEDLEDLVDLAVAGKERLARAHLREDASHRPHVHAGAVGPAAQQDLGRAVPQGHDL